MYLFSPGPITPGQCHLSAVTMLSVFGVTAVPGHSHWSPPPGAVCPGVALSIVTWRLTPVHTSPGRARAPALGGSETEEPETEARLWSPAHRGRVVRGWPHTLRVSTLVSLRPGRADQETPCPRPCL